MVELIEAIASNAFYFLAAAILILSIGLYFDRNQTYTDISSLHTRLSTNQLELDDLKQNTDSKLNFYTASIADLKENLREVSIARSQVSVTTSALPLPPAINVTTGRKKLNLFFAANFNEIFKTAALQWLNETFFCHSFQETFNETERDVLVTTHEIVNATASNANCSGGCFYGGLNVIVVYPQFQRFGIASEKNVVLHEFAHYFNVSVHDDDPPSKLPNSVWSVKNLKEYLQKC